MPGRRASPDPAVRPSDNQLLAALPREEYDLFAARCAIVHLRTSDPIHEAGAVMEHVYFPLTGVASVTTLMADGAMVEVGTIGCEGTTGLPTFFGAEASPLRAFGPITGDYTRLTVADFREAARPGTALFGLLQRYAQAYYVLTAQSAGCNRLHPNEERCARWLLLTQDRVGAATFPLSHEFLGHMLGTRRASVTIAMGTLQAARLVTYRRGIVTVLDRSGLEEAACECYAIIRQAFETMLPTQG